MSLLDFPGDKKKCMRQVDDYASECLLWNDRVLVRVRADDPCCRRLLYRLKNAESGCVCILKNYVSATRDLCDSLFLSGAGIIPISYVGAQKFDCGINGTSAPLKCFEAAFHRRQLGAPNDTQCIRFCHFAGNHSCDI